MKISATGSKFFFSMLCFFLQVHQTNFIYAQSVDCCMFSKYTTKALLTGVSAKCNSGKCRHSHVGVWGVGGAAVTVGVEVLERAVELVMDAAL